jgi:hypothetical protein
MRKRCVKCGDIDPDSGVGVTTICEVCLGQMRMESLRCDILEMIHRMNEEQLKHVRTLVDHLFSVT